MRPRRVARGLARQWRGHSGLSRFAIVRWPSVEAFHVAVRTSAIVTHAHPEAIDAALVQAQAVALVLSEPNLVHTPFAFLDSLSSRLPRLDPAISNGLATVGERLQSG